MPLDPLTALSLAASAIQLVDFSGKVISKGKSLYKSVEGVTRENAELEESTARLKESCIGLKNALPPETAGLTIDEERLRETCEACALVSEELISCLQSLRVSSRARHRGLESLRKALKTVLSSSKSDALLERLTNLRAELDTHILILLEARFGRLTIDQDDGFKQLDNDLRALISSIIDSRKWQSEFQEREFHKLAQKLDTKTQAIISTVVEAALGQSKEFIRQSETMGKNKHTIINTVFETQTALNEDLLRRLEAALIKNKAQKAKERLEHVFLENLRSRSRSDRSEGIAPAHRRTLEWIFKDPQKNNKPWDSFLEWLTDGSGVYWIEGKAASGKSTLMRYIRNHPKTRECLERWSLPSQLVTASHFFWNSGNEAQRSHIGLISSLLYEILGKHKEFIPRLFPEEWERTIRVACRQGQSSHAWSLSSLRKAFRDLIDLNTEGFKFCFFIDGLDEHDGDAGEIAEYFWDLSQLTPKVKFCVSSRPWAEFQTIYRACPKLRLQDLTHDDIMLYVGDKLGKNEQMRQLLTESSENASFLIEEVVNKADGVFLWVTLIVKAIISGLRQGDEIYHLRRRLASLPPDLEALYEHMLKSIDPLDLEEASKMLQTFRASGHDLTVADLERSLRFTDYRKVIEMEMHNGISSIWEMERLGNICERLLFRLNSRTKGLLEVPGVHHSGIESRLNPEILEQQDECSSSSERLQTSSDEDNESPGPEAADCLHQLSAQEATISRKRKRDEQDFEALPAVRVYDPIDREDLHTSTESSPLKVESSNHYLKSWNSRLLQPQMLEEAFYTTPPAELPLAPLNPYEGMGITYLHRTARDYLEQQTVWAGLMTHTNGTGFSPHTALLMGSVIFVKSAGHKNRHALGVHDRSWQTLGSAAFYELSCSEGHTALAKELDRALNFQWGSTHLS